MFNNVIYFIIVLLIFNISYPENSQGNPLSYSLAMILICWVVFLFYCRNGFSRLAYQYGKGVGNNLSNKYHGLVLQLSVFAIFLFSLDVYIFQLKYWLHAIPGVKRFSVLEGILAISVFLFYLATIWHYSHAAYALLFNSNISRRSFIISNLKLNLPILFPWLVLSFFYDLIAFSPWSGPEDFLGRIEGQVIFFAFFLTILMIFMPPVIRNWWGCTPFGQSDRIDELKGFLDKMGFRYRDLMRWPIFEGRMVTAGIMGVMPRYRYILITDSLMEILSVEELKAVMAHEVGHAKYGHLFFYVLFFLGYIAISFGLFEIFSNILAFNPFLIGVFNRTGAQATNLFYLILSIPILLTILIYFRFLMGFYMRNFERQADLYSAVVMGSPGPTISSLEKIALVSGKIRDLPSWHHFSIKERVDYLWRFLKEPSLVNRHNRMITLSFAIYLICAIGLGYYLNFSPMKHDLQYKLASNMLQRQISEDPDNIDLLRSLATVYQEMNRYAEAKEAYERILLLDGEQAIALNNLAWLLVTVPDEALRDPERALVLAEKAVAIERSPTFLDTLAEAYYTNGSIQKAIKTINEAIALERVDDGYYIKQLERFSK
ncbi:MAG TPA: M48 family metalloprotease [Desulfatiglandales bacterium]|nr:M48 family metalloprotease [Desulfatiglandales bacterium]